MKWKGETHQQYQARISNWHLSFLWLPKQMRDGTWVWLEYVWRKRNKHYGGDSWMYSDTLMIEELHSPTTPPPTPRKK